MRILFSRIVLFKRHVCDIKKWRLEHDLPISVNGCVILPFHEGFFVCKTLFQQSFAKIKPLKKILTLQYVAGKIILDTDL